MWNKVKPIHFQFQGHIEHIFRGDYWHTGTHKWHLLKIKRLSQAANLMRVERGVWGMSEHHFSCRTERTRADFRVYRQHCAKYLKEAEKYNKKRRLSEIPKRPGLMAKKTKHQATHKWVKLKSINS